MAAVLLLHPAAVCNDVKTCPSLLERETLSGRLEEVSTQRPVEHLHPTKCIMCRVNFTMLPTIMAIISRDRGFI